MNSTFAKRVRKSATAVQTSLKFPLKDGSGSVKISIPVFYLSHNEFNMRRAAELYGCTVRIRTPTSDSRISYGPGEDAVKAFDAAVESGVTEVSNY